MKKKLTLVLCLLSCMLLMAGCSLSLTKTNENFDKATLKANAESFISSWFETDFAGIVEQYKGQEDQLDDEMLAQFEEIKNYAKMRDQYGEMGKIVGDAEYTINSDAATVTETVTTSSGKKLVFSVTYDEKGQYSASKVEEYRSMADKMGKAGLNTVMSMAIVFAVLIFISLIIGCFKFIGRIQNKKNAKKSENVAAAPVPAAVPVEEDPMDDLELVAVITAAVVAASETESADGLVVRSIVRR